MRCVRSKPIQLTGTKDRHVMARISIQSLRKKKREDTPVVCLWAAIYAVNCAYMTVVAVSLSLHLHLHLHWVFVELATNPVSKKSIMKDLITRIAVYLFLNRRFGH